MSRPRACDEGEVKYLSVFDPLAQPRSGGSVNRCKMTRRRCITGITAALLTPVSATSRAATAGSRHWQALQAALRNIRRRAQCFGRERRR